jgi:proteic killer suppression protein
VFAALVNEPGRRLAPCGIPRSCKTLYPETNLELAFATKKLRTICENERVAERQLGVSLAKKLRARVTDLRAAETVDELAAGNPRELKGSCFGVELGVGWKLVFAANHITLPQKGSRVDWSRVSRVKVLRIERSS